jgi:hypothetical protein
LRGRQQELESPQGVAMRGVKQSEGADPVQSPEGYVLLPIISHPHERVKLRTL